MSERPRIFVMNDPHAMRINPYLADEIGFQESVVFLQIEYLIRTTKDPSRAVLRDGRWWYRATLQELSEEQFSWWSRATIGRVMNRLEERSLISVDDTNAVGYDRTQWYAIDEEGVRNLDSIAISQNETAISHSETPISQNETTIQGELVGELKESTSNEVPKKVESPTAHDCSSPRKIKALKDSESEERFEELCERSKHGDALRTLSELLAEGNKTGQVAMTRAWREIGQRYLANRKRYGEVSEEAWAYGFEVAIAKGAGNIGYVTAAARGYRPGSRSAGKSRRSIAVIGATEDDYREEDYNFHV